MSLVAAIVIAGYTIARQSAIFPNSQIVLEAKTFSRSHDRQTALTLVRQAQARVVAFLGTNGISRDRLAVSTAIAEGTDHDGWSGEAQVDTPALPYSTVARISNRAGYAFANDQAVGFEVPSAPFMSTIIWIGFVALILLLFSVAALDTRSNDPNRAPRGMHPVMLTTQSLLIGLLIVAAIANAHLLLTGARVGLPVIAIFGVLSCAVWLIRSRKYWRVDRSLRLAYGAYWTLLVVAALTCAWSVSIPLT